MNNTQLTMLSYLMLFDSSNKFDRIVPASVVHFSPASNARECQLLKHLTPGGVLIKPQLRDQYELPIHFSQNFYQVHMKLHTTLLHMHTLTILAILQLRYHFYLQISTLHLFTSLQPCQTTIPTPHMTDLHITTQFVYYNLAHLPEGLKTR